MVLLSGAAARRNLKNRLKMTEFRVLQCRCTPDFIHFDPGVVESFATKKGGTDFIDPPESISLLK